MPNRNRKRRTRAHIIADLGVNHVERHVLLCGWSVQRFSPDYGLDLLMTTFNRRDEIENGDVRLQVKATDSIKLFSKGKAVVIRVEWRDVLYWLNEPLPVILVVYDARSDRAWWLHLNEALRNKRQDLSARASLTVSVPFDNVLGAVAVRRFRRFRDKALARTRD